MISKLYCHTEDKKKSYIQTKVMMVVHTCNPIYIYTNKAPEVNNTFSNKFAFAFYCCFLECSTIIMKKKRKCRAGRIRVWMRV